MSIKKSLLTLAVTALALMGFASSAMAATDGVVRDTNGSIIANGATLHAVGFAKFSASVGSYECHVTGTLKATGTTGSTGEVVAGTGFTVPDKTKCTGTGFLAGCLLASQVTKNLPYHVTATLTDLDVTGSIVLVNHYASCIITEQTLTFGEITLTPLKTGSETVTGTGGKLGGTALGDEIAGVEISGGGTVQPGGLTVTASGKLELTSPERCTYKLAAS
jgi:hypothetical protein